MTDLGIKGFVYVGWLISLSLHEFSHSLTAYCGGDRDIKRRGYLTLDPFRFMDPLYSLVIPMLLLLMGGIGLPGGATYVDRSALRSKWWETAVSLAGPAANLGLVFLLTLPFMLGVIDPNTPLAAAIAFLAALQIGAFLFNLIPIPPLDGFGGIAPHLSHDVVSQGRQMGRMGYLLIFGAFWFVPGMGSAFWGGIALIAQLFHIPAFSIAAGYDGARLW